MVFHEVYVEWEIAVNKYSMTSGMLLSNASIYQYLKLYIPCTLFVYIVLIKVLINGELPLKSESHGTLEFDRFVQNIS